MCCPTKIKLTVWIFFIFTLPVHVLAADIVEVIDVINPYPPQKDLSNSKNLSRKHKLEAYLASRHQKDIQITLNLVPLARARHIVNNKNWCISFVPPIDKSQVLSQPLDKHIQKIKLFRLRQKDTFEWQNSPQNNNKLVAIIRDSEQSIMYLTLTKAGFKPIQVTTFEHGILMLLKGHVDYAVAQDNTLDNMQNSIELKAKLQASSHSLLEYQTSVYVNKQCKIASMFDGKFP